MKSESVAIPVRNVRNVINMIANTDRIVKKTCIKISIIDPMKPSPLSPLNGVLPSKSKIFIIQNRKRILGKIIVIIQSIIGLRNINLMFSFSINQIQYNSNPKPSN